MTTPRDKADRTISNILPPLGRRPKPVVSKNRLEAAGLAATTDIAAVTIGILTSFLPLPPPLSTIVASVGGAWAGDVIDDHIIPEVLVRMDDREKALEEDLTKLVPELPAVLATFIRRDMER